MSNPENLALRQDQDVRDMAEDVQISLDFGDPMDTWFEADGTPQDWFIEAANEEYTRRTGRGVDGPAIAEAIYGILTS